MFHKKPLAQLIGNNIIQIFPQLSFDRFYKKYSEQVIRNLYSASAKENLENIKEKSKTCNSDNKDYAFRTHPELLGKSFNVINRDLKNVFSIF